MEAVKRTIHEYDANCGCLFCMHYCIILINEYYISRNANERLCRNVDDFYEVERLCWKKIYNYAKEMKLQDLEESEKREITFICKCFGEVKVKVICQYFNMYMIVITFHNKEKVTTCVIQQRVLIDNSDELVMY